MMIVTCVGTLKMKRDYLPGNSVSKEGTKTDDGYLIGTIVPQFTGVSIMCDPTMYVYSVYLQWSSSLQSLGLLTHQA